MKRLVTLCMIAVFGICTMSAADKVEGLWKSIDETTGKTTAAWNIYQKNNVLYGTMITVFGQDDSTIASKCKTSYPGFPVAGDVSKMTVINTPFIYGLKMKEPGRWEGGKIINPGDGTLYECKIKFKPANASTGKDILEMRGEIGLGIGKSQLWERTTEAEIASLRK